FHDFRNVFNLTPNDLMDKGEAYIANYVSVFKKRISSNTTLDSVVQNDFKSIYNTEVFNPKKYTARTKYGESIVVTYKAKHGTYEYECIQQFYKYKGFYYKVSYVAQDKYFDTYYDDAIAIMKTFKIAE
uniref:hypothetical protein n=1 Tax=Kordia jejudonensis TaxID=1348245 RepID=UPI0006292417